MKKLLSVLMISLLVLGGCETYCERNYPTEIFVDPMAMPSLSEVGYPEGPEEGLEIVYRIQLPVDDPNYLSPERAFSAILAVYGVPLMILNELWQFWADDLLGQLPDG